MSDFRDEYGHRTKRFKYQSYNEQLKGVHAPTALERSKVDEALEDEECLFHAALSHWMQLNLSPSFISFAREALPLSQSLALLIHSWKEVTDLWLDCVRNADDEALKALLDLLQKLVEDLRSTVSSAYGSIICCLFELLPRRVAPEVLSGLLAASATVFKHVLVPLAPKTEPFDALTMTWIHITAVLPKCNAEIHRAVGEIWSSVYRRLKKDERQKCVSLMISSALSLDDFVAWSCIFAAKSVGQTIRSAGPTLVVTCLDHHLAASEDEAAATFKLLRRLLTALIHHCSKADQFSPIADSLIEKLALQTEPEHVQRLLDVLAVLCSVRNGSRLNSKQLSNILDATTKLPYEKTLHVPFLTIVTAALCASSADLSVWMGAGRRVIEWTWSTDKALAVAITGSLYAAGWKGFTKFAMPPFLKNCLVLLMPEEISEGDESRLQVQTLRVLSELAKSDMLKNLDDTWRSHLATFIRSWLEHFDISESSVMVLPEVLSLLPNLSAYDLRASLASISQRLIAETAGEERGFDRTWANETVVFSQLVRVIAKNKASALPPNFDAVQVVCAAIKKWSWSEYVMEGIVSLAKTYQYSGPEPIPDHFPIVDKLICNLRSHSHIIRRTSLELLSLGWLCPSSFTDAVKRCLVTELVPLTVQGVRERVVLTGRVGQVVPDDDRIAQLCVSWLLGQLKVGLRPVWTPTAQALGALSGRSPDTVWTMVFAELRDFEQLSQSTSMPAWLAEEADEKDDINEQERSWRDPSAHKFRLIISNWTSNSMCKDAIIEHQKPRDRIDSRSYEAQLLVTLGEFSALAERHSRDLVPLFLLFASTSSTEKASRMRLTNWLKLFSKFTNPKAFHSSAAVHAIYAKLLAHPDRGLQSAALSCLQTFKTPALSRKSDTLTNLLDDTKWRDEVTMLNLHELTPEERDGLIPVIIRLFYGMMRERGGRGKGSDRRSALLGALSSCTNDELTLLVDLMVEPLAGKVNLDIPDDASEEWRLSDTPLDLPEKQQIGFFMFLGDVLRILGSRVMQSWPRLIASVITLTASAQRELQNSAEGIRGQEEDIENEVDEEKENEGGKSASHTPTRLRQMRLVRQLGLKRLADFFRLPTEFLFSPYMPELYRAIVSPRIPLLDRENIQAPSSLLELLDVWSLQPDTAVYLVQYDPRTLKKVFDCLVATNVKPSVQMRVFDLLERLLTFSSEDEPFSDLAVKPYMSGLLDNMALAVQRSTNNGAASAVGLVAQREIAILSKLSPYIVDGNQAATLLSLFLPQLRRAGRGIPEAAKADMLGILCNLMPQIPDFSTKNIALFEKTHETLSFLFQLLRGRQARLALVRAFDALAGIDFSLMPTAALLASLNSYSITRMEEPDFDRRLGAFADLNEDRWGNLGWREWSPFLHNMLNFIQDEGELSIRTNAALSMKRFLEVLSASQEPDLQACFVRILFPGLKRSLRAKSDLVRAEVMGVLAFAVERCDNVNALQEMRILLAAGDEEANFFNNVFHIQIHRRTRALRRLADFCDEPGFRSSSLQEIFVPVVNSFISSSGMTDHHLVNEAITTLGRIAKHLAWPAYFALVQQYIRLATEKTAAERTYTRALVSVLDNFHFTMEDTFVEEAEVEGEGDIAEPVETQVPSVTTKIHEAVIHRLLPTLLKHLEQRDELEDSNRIPLAIGITKVSLHLPAASRDVQVPRLLTVLSQIFRSKSQETRDITRETLCRISIMLGSSYLPMIIRQLREALVRGPHLHVLAFVTHALLVHITSLDNAAAVENLDDCVADVVHISTEVVFGQSGKDVESEGFKTKMKEVRGSSGKGMDSFAILAKHISPAATSNLLLPVKAIMQETESVKSMQVVDEVLRRMSVGLNANKHFGPSEVLVFCHSLISQNARFFQEKAKVQKRKAKKVDDAVVQLKRKIEADNDHYSHNSWRFVTFGLDLFITACRRGRFAFNDANVISRLEPMVNVIGNTLYASNGSVISSGLKAVAQIAKCPLKNVEKSLPIFVRQTLQIIRETGSSEADVVQTAFKTLAVILRDCQSSQLKEKDLTFLLELLTPDLEEVTRQATAFSLLRSIVSRKFVVPEIYDLMDRVGEIMVTSQSTQVRELCRSVLLQFLLDYPQGKNRLKQQLTFLVKNLSYVFESGRKSVLELLSAIISKFNDEIVAEYADMLFVSLVLVVANDESTKCREMAAQLVKTLFDRLKEDQQKSIISHVHTWAAQRDNAALGRVASQIYGLVLDTLKANAKPYLPLLLDDVNVKVQDSADAFEQMDEGIVLSEADWQVPYQALTTLSKVFQQFPNVVRENNKVSWPSITALLLYPHAWVRTASCRLLGSLFAVTTVGAPDCQLPDDSPLSMKGMKEVADSLTLQLKSENLDESLALQVVKNLFYVGKCFYAIPNPDMDMETQKKEDKEEVEAAEGSDNDFSDGENEKSNTDENDTSLSTASDPLPWLFSRLSYQARSAHISRINKPSQNLNWSRQLTAIFQWFAAMTSYMDGARLTQYLPHILSPLYRVAEDDSIRDPQMDALKSLITELQSLLQTKVGVSAFASAYARIRARVLVVRQERKTQRVMCETRNPRAANERKVRRHVGKRKREKERKGEKKMKMGGLKRRRTD